MRSDYGVASRGIPRRSGDLFTVLVGKFIFRQGVKLERCEIINKGQV